MTAPLTMFGTMSLGDLTTRMAAEDPRKTVRFAFGDLGPGSLASYRGYYDHLAVSYDDDHTPSVADFLAKLRAANGATLQGYKGGSYHMHNDTPVWVSNYGRCSGCGIVDVTSNDCDVVLVTAMVDR